LALSTETGPDPVSHARLRVLVADDHEELLAGVSDFLSREFEIVGAAGDGASLVDLADKLRPDVIVTDLRMPRLSGIDAGRTILGAGFCKAVVVLTVFADAKLAAVALQAGILGYVFKVNAGEDLIPAISHALKGEIFISSAIASKMNGFPSELNAGSLDAQT
jgi:DNA-binding NarL/FixJ family response regulator